MVRNKYLFVLIFFLLITKSYSLELEGNWQLINADKTKVKVENNRNTYFLIGDVKIKTEEDFYSAKEIIFKPYENTVELFDDVQIRRKESKINSGYAKFDTKKEILNCTDLKEIQQENLSLKGKKSEYNIKKSILEVKEDVFFESKKYYGMADYLIYKMDSNQVKLEGIPYIGFENNFLGGDTIIIKLGESENINEIIINRHGDLYWEKENDKIEINSDYIRILFSKNNKMDEAILEGDVRGYIKKKGEKNTINGRYMKVNFIDEDINDVIIKGRVKGKYIFKKEKDINDEK